MTQKELSIAKVILALAPNSSILNKPHPPPLILARQPVRSPTTQFNSSWGSQGQHFWSYYILELHYNRSRQMAQQKATNSASQRAN
jgi:hypothetical protein